MKVLHVAKGDLLILLMKDKTHKTCLQQVLQQHSLCKEDVNACTWALYYELSKHAHGNTLELVVHNSEHTITKVATLEVVFCALKTKGCFNMDMKIIVQ